MAASEPAPGVAVIGLADGVVVQHDVAQQLRARMDTDLWCLLPSCGLVDAIGALTPRVLCAVPYPLLEREALSDEIEESFGTMPNDLALEAIVAAVDVSLRELLGATPGPLPIAGGDFVLTYLTRGSSSSISRKVSARRMGLAR